MPHDGLVIADVSCSKLPASRSANAWRSIETSALGAHRRRLLRDDAIHRLDQLGGELAVRAELGGFLRVGMRVDVAALAGERARHRVEADDADVSRALLSRDQLLRDLLALDELAEPVEAGRERDEQRRRRVEPSLTARAAGLDGDRVVVGAGRGEREQRPVLGGAEPARRVAQDRHGVDDSGRRRRARGRSARGASLRSCAASTRIASSARPARASATARLCARLALPGSTRDRPAQVLDGDVEAGPRTRRRGRRRTRDRRRSASRCRRVATARASSASAAGALLRGRRGHAATRGREAVVRACRPRAGPCATRSHGAATPVGFASAAIQWTSSCACAGARARGGDRPRERDAAGLDRARAALEQHRRRLVLRRIAGEIVREPQLPADPLVAAQQALRRSAARR